MTTENARIFGCPSCGAAVTGFESECPICHFKFGPDIKFECPVCGQQVSPGIKSCPACEVNFYRIAAKAVDDVVERTTEQLLEELITFEAGLVKESGMKFTCPNCSKLLRGDEGSCPSCGHKVPSTSMLTCPRCATNLR